LTDEELNERERQEDEANAGCFMQGLGCCLLDAVLSAFVLVGLMFLPFHLLF